MELNCKTQTFFLLKVSFQTAYIPLKNLLKQSFFFNRNTSYLLNSMMFTLAINLIVLMMNERYVHVLYIYKKHHTTRHYGLFLSCMHITTLTLSKTRPKRDNSVINYSFKNNLYFLTLLCKSNNWTVLMITINMELNNKIYKEHYQHIAYASTCSCNEMVIQHFNPSMSGIKLI